MKLIRLISILLDYPDDRVVLAHDELYREIEASADLGLRHKAALIKLLKRMVAFDLMDLQEEYLDLFDRGRNLSLFLFEHVHGESRDRGQAMVDLLQQYQTAGFAIDARELPDYLPLYLEYLSMLDRDGINAGLADISHILRVMMERLGERGSLYSACFSTLLDLCGCAVDEVPEVGMTRPQHIPEASLEALDRQWEEEAVNFMQAESQQCSSMTASSRQPQAFPEVPVHWVGFNDDKPSAVAARVEVRHV